MKKALLLLATISVFASCAPKQEPKVMARFVPERMDDFVFENNYIAGRLYGQALEGNPTSPGVDIWVKTAGPLVADQRYKDELENGKSYHIDWGNGKDCYKVAVSLGGGASAPFVDGKILFPQTNFHEWKIMEQTPETVSFVLKYPQWSYEGVSISLDKKITLTADSYFCKVEDCYTFEGTESLPVVAGVFRHPTQNTIEEERVETDRYAIWEHASDQSVEPEDGMIGVAVYMPGADSTFVMEDCSHGVCLKTVKSGEALSYYFGNCWSKAEIKTVGEWFKLVDSLN